MKTTRLFYMIILSLWISSCKPENKENGKQQTATEITSSSKAGKAEKRAQDIDLSQYSRLIPVELKDSKSTDVLKKYGIEFSGNCYSCDLAIIKINEKNFDIVNVCDENDFERFKKFNYENSGNILKIATAETTFIFTKVEKEPVYQLKIEGKQPDFKNKRISQFYTPENLINKFEEHDCGDFEG
ncbi:hypothetical protein [Chryseobacterium chendengshani]|uniref:hypothetical protein n=1 Tax=Chryseobacterium sp. LJ756 TaxID=2864113 RepID=UPI001C63C0BC|nr:hypothetical protein [Chryseobacterium sp. LJ756]MBW7676701.1 hypothetical protein [Chryseobacterium sp. LJ756]